MDDLFEGLLENDVSIEDRLKTCFREIFVNVTKTRNLVQAQLFAQEVLRLVATEFLREQDPKNWAFFTADRPHEFFDRQLFCGDGERSSAKIGLLFLLLDQAISNLGGSQQLTYHGPMFEPKNRTRKEEIEHLDLQRKAAVNNILTALSGKV